MTKMVPLTAREHESLLHPPAETCLPVHFSLSEKQLCPICSGIAFVAFSSPTVGLLHLPLQFFYLSKLLACLPSWRSSNHSSRKFLWISEERNVKNEKSKFIVTSPHSWTPQNWRKIFTHHMISHDVSVLFFIFSLVCAPHMGNKPFL